MGLGALGRWLVGVGVAVPELSVEARRSQDKAGRQRKENGKKKTR